MNELIETAGIALEKLRVLPTWPAGSTHRILMVSIRAGDVPDALAKRLKAAGLGDYLADPDDVVELGPARMLSMIGPVYGPEPTYPLEQVVRLTRATTPLAGRLAAAEEAQRAAAESLARRQAEQQKRADEYQRREAARVEAERRRDPAYVLAAMQKKLADLEARR